MTAGLIVIVYAIVKAEELGWGSAGTLGLAALGVALLAAFGVIERRPRRRWCGSASSRCARCWAPTLVMLVVAGGLYANFFFSSIYVQQILGYGPFEAGLTFLPVTAGIVIGSGLSQVLVKTVGVRATTMAGMSMAATGLYVLSQASVDGTYLGTLLPGLIPMSIGMGLTFVPVTLIATANVEAEDAGLASGLFNTSQQIGAALGVAVLATLAADKTADVLGGLGRAPVPSDQAIALVGGFQVAFFGAACLVLLGVALLGLLVRRRDVANVDPEQAIVPGA